MKGKFSTFRNGASLPRHDIPEKSAGDFLRDILEATDHGWRVSAYFGVQDRGSLHLYCLIASESQGLLGMAATKVSGDTFPSIASLCPQIQMFEREIAEQFKLDTALSHRLLQATRSAAIALNRPLESIQEAVMMLAKIAAFTETHRPRTTLAARRELLQKEAARTGGDRMASLVEHALDTVPCDLLLVPTRGGTIARVISRCKPPVWIIAPSCDPAACQSLAFSYGVHPVELADEPNDWRDWVVHWLRENRVTAERIMLVAGPSARQQNREPASSVLYEGVRRPRAGNRYGVSSRCERPRLFGGGRPERG